MASLEKCPRLSFQQAMELTRLPNRESGTGSVMLRFMNRQPPWATGDAIPWEASGIPRPPGTKVAFGGVVYAQAPLAAARAIESRADSNSDKDRAFGIHSIHAVFTSPGLVDRPFVFEVSETQHGRSFATLLVNVRQPAEPSAEPAGPFSVKDSQKPLSAPCLTSIVTFRRPSSTTEVAQGIPPSERYHAILTSKLPTEWEPCPQIDIDVFSRAFSDVGHGTFPILDMHKVDMTQYNSTRGSGEQKQLILYRPLSPLPEDDIDAHVVCHAFAADRNGLIMFGNQLGYGYGLGRAATLSYSFYVHVNAADAMFRGHGWWILEHSWPRYEAGRAAMSTLIWSPEGKHVATAYQDGILYPALPSADAKL
ncbi:uncharacterized protein NECHADRAFT_95805 [Fusarium vanettenii 77-13-4]|uniref:Acyl-CoA thioesterase II n=1 Tax=Fusarium vanettenii (strain ATCC MYA-4622 / CBS 123669 / FGSC 9596 / NRRL 45880 / 77-13-4) TaxID=660122 RepID=C7YZT4_FUSV7|nr:uncharacterized protein NECHADRAFT_95805 [Fusarium vanettenii 77-13-4]EEU42664.1 hypothetical protein NECHADRAFT_95805 [Fusarium vanettenii 77-13-4]